MTWRDDSHTRERGNHGEDLAVDWLERHGYRTVARNVRTRAGEIDVVAWEREILCFLEIKARASRTYGPAVAAVPITKQRRLAHAAASYLAHRPTDAPCRFDVLAMDLEPGGAWRFTLIRDAFQVPG